MAEGGSGTDDITKKLEKKCKISEKDEKVNHMYETVLHHSGDFGKALKTHLFYNVDKQIYNCFTNQKRSGGNRHAEELFVEKTETMTRPYSFKAKHVELTVFISNSPCSSSDHNCAKKLRDFVMTCQNVSLIVYVTHLYKVFRESCEEHIWHMIDDDFYVNTCGLWNLVHQERCEVKPYNRTVWNELLSSDFCISSEVKEKLLNDYDKKRDYYDRNGKYQGTNDRSREEEDGLIEKDLKAIGFQILKQLLEIKDPSRKYKYTCIVCNITAGKNTFKLAKSDQRDKHAEELLLEELEKLGPKDEPLTITIFMNDTPCSLAGHDCAGKFVQYLKTAKVKLTVYSTSLCESKEETCTQKEKKGDKFHIIHPDCSKKDEPAHKKGLASLKQHCAIQSPNRDAWQKLFSIMNLSENDEIIKDFWEKYEKQEKDGIEKKDVIKKYLDNL